MFCMCIDRKCVVNRESTLSSLCVFTEGALIQVISWICIEKAVLLEGRVSYVLYVY